MTHAAPGVPASAGYLPLPRVAPGRPAQASARSAAGGVREAEGHYSDPGAAVVDSQVVKVTPAGGMERGHDRAKRSRAAVEVPRPGGHKRAVLVEGSIAPISALGTTEGRLLGEGLPQELPRMGLVLADGAYTGGFRLGGPKRSGGGGWRCRTTATGGVLALRFGREVVRVPGVAEEAGGGEDVRLAGPVATPKQKATSICRRPRSTPR